MSGGWLRGTPSLSAVAEATRSLAVLVEARLPPSRALRLVTEQCQSTALTAVLTRVSADVESGRSLGESLRRHPTVFSRLYVHLVTVGEAVGDLGPILRRLAEHVERTYALRRSVRLALVYPGAILAVAVLVVGFMLGAVVPMFAAMFEGFGAELPGPTRAVLALSGALRTYGLWALAGLAASGWAIGRALKTEAGGRAADALWLRLPVLGAIRKKSVAARFCRTLGTLVERGVPFTEALRLLPAAIDSPLMRAEVEALRRDAARGQSLSERLLRAEYFPPLVGQMMLVGEETARIDEVLLRTAALYEEELETTVDTLASVLEPALILLIGLVVGGILVALYLPMLDLVTVIG